MTEVAARPGGADRGFMSLVSKEMRSEGVWWRLAAVVSVVVLFALNVIVSRTAVAPRTPWDEIGPLEMSRMLAGRGPVPQMAGAGYYPGWAILLTPIWWFTGDPATAYRVAIWVVIALAMLTVWPLARIGTRLGLSMPQAVTGAALALSLPARTVNADYVLSENLLTLIYVLATLAACRLWERPGVARVVCFATAVTAAYLTHVRALSLVIVAVVWLLMFMLRDWKLGALGAVLVAAGYKVVGVLVQLITVPLLLGGFEQDERFFSRIDGMTPSLVVRVAFSQFWGQLAGSFGLVAVGLVVLVSWAVWEISRGRKIGPASFVLAFFLVTMAVSVVKWSVPGPQTRLDAQVYTRYIDPAALQLVFVGVAVALRGARRWLIAASAGLALLDIAVVMLKVAPWANTWGTTYGPANSAAVLAWFRMKPDHEFAHPLVPAPGNANELWFWASVSVLVFFVILWFLRGHPKVLSGVMLVAFATLSWYSNPAQSRDTPEPLVTSLARIETTTGLPADSLSVDFDLSCHGPKDTYSQVLNWSGYWLYPRELRTVDPRNEGFDSDLVISCADWPEADAFGAAEIKGSEYYNYSLWVLPGSLQDTLVSDGLAESLK